MPLCIKCNKIKSKDEMFYNTALQRYRNICIRCRKDEMVQYNLEKAKTKDKQTIIHLRNVLRKMVEALEDRNSKQLRLWADVARIEISKQKCEARWGRYDDN